MSNTFNVNNAGQIGQQNIGQSGGEATANVEIGGAAVTPREVFRALEDAIPEAEREAMVDEVIEPLRTMAELPPEEQEKPEQKEKAAGFIARLMPYAPAAQAAVLAFGEGALSALVSSNPVVRGVLEAIKAVRTKVE